MTRFEQTLNTLKESSNLRRLPPDAPDGDLIDLTSNDYLGIAKNREWQDRFYATAAPEELALTSSASRLLASSQKVYSDLEKLLETLYPGRKALLFNSGYHANTGIIPALADSKTLILADKLVHASIIDGIKLSQAPFKRFRHNDFVQLEKLLAQESTAYRDILVIVESIYSMDGDSADISRLIQLKHRYPNVILYVDEAHAFGVSGKNGLGLAKDADPNNRVDIIVGTLGKAAASSGAFALTSATVHDYLLNKSRSLIFSTAIPPVSAAWSRFVIERIPSLDSERLRLKQLSKAVGQTIGATDKSHIIPYIIGDAARTIEMSLKLAQQGVKVLPIRTPTVPPGTERLRISLSADISDAQLLTITAALQSL